MCECMRFFVCAWYWCIKYHLFRVIWLITVTVTVCGTDVLRSISSKKYFREEPNLYGCNHVKIGYAIPTHHCVCMGHRYRWCSESCVQMSAECNCYLMRTPDKYFSQKNPRNLLRQDCSVMIRKSSEVHASFIRKWFGQNLQNFQESFSTCSK